MMRWIVMAAAIALPVEASAHPHRYVDQQVQLSIGSSTVELAIVIVPSRADGTAILSSMDGDGDDRVSDREAREFAADVLSATNLTVDGRTFSFDLEHVDIPEMDDIANGTAAITVHGSTALQMAERQDHSVAFAIKYEAFSHDWFVQPFLSPNLLGRISQLQVHRSDVAARVVVQFSTR